MQCNARGEREETNHSDENRSLTAIALRPCVLTFGGLSSQKNESRLVLSQA